MDTFRATIGKYGLLLIPASGHTDLYHLATKYTYHLQFKFVKAQPNVKLAPNWNELQFRASLDNHNTLPTYLSQLVGHTLKQLVP